MANRSHPQPLSVEKIELPVDRRCVLTIDVEDWYHCLDENPSHWDHYKDRIEISTYRLLDLLDEKKVKAIFFVLAHVAKMHPRLVREIAARGHEVGSHGCDHRFVYKLSPQAFAADVRKSLAILSDLVGNAVTGYRAPYFSITRRSLWALEILRESGITYDSSIFPVHNHRYGIPDAPRQPYRTDSGILEFPPCTFPIGKLNIPCAGGVYFRFAPYPILRSLVRSLLRREEAIIFYLHPWEIDPDQPRVSVAPFLRFRHYYGLRRTEHKLSRLLTDFPFGPVAEILPTP